MLIVTDLKKVNDLYESKTPRPIREVMLEIYPDATEDANGRFHAPYDGYECQLTGKIFRGGEYLPCNEPDDNYRVMSGDRRRPTATDLSGKIHTWDGTRAQEVAVWRELLEQHKTYMAAKSTWIATEGDKVTLELIIDHITSYDTMYGTTFVSIMRDKDFNVVIYKGKKLRTGPNPYLDRDFEKGDKIKLAAKVKSHKIREDVKQTIIERPKVLKE
jgi:hypothetical protein